MVEVSEGKLLTPEGEVVGTYKDEQELMPNLIICMPFDDEVALFSNNGFLRDNKSHPNKVFPISNIRGLESILRRTESGMFTQTPELFDVLKAFAKANSSNVIETGYEPQKVYDIHFVAYLNESAGN